ncbi:DVU_1555 family C-GCAxxG-C-C protein [Geosporobacter ferrireducens]|uniref:Redox-active protein n=1 Tax=Geosporobacter ferrireducens TaxID=1424294 RepID=A0A1D8GKM2_9FIRM|nr:DV_1555 family C-GCAxxG-C-C protein [Geosporobacter ferrireducens]AOT71466.1 redox-active protein [Geosporobacter ferrireducens]MTI57774.1 C_GCAxxG_C_C family protein [Geosporobacter ferrireducens]
MNETAFKMLRMISAGLCCTQVMIKLALEEEEKENADLIRAVSGLCKGIGGSQKTCGVLTGGIGILGLYSGKGKETEYAREDHGSMVEEYMTWFENVFRSTECMDIIGVYSFTDDTSNMAYNIKCGDILLRSYEKIQEILRDHDYEFGSRE